MGGYYGPEGKQRQPGFLAVDQSIAGLGQKNLEAMIAVQKHFFDAVNKANRECLAGLHDEASTFAKKVTPGSLDETIDLIRKLRWMGLDDEAKRLEAAVSSEKHRHTLTATAVERTCRRFRSIAPSR